MNCYYFKSEIESLNVFFNSSVMFHGLTAGHNNCSSLCETAQHQGQVINIDKHQSKDGATISIMLSGLGSITVLIPLQQTVNILQQI